MTIRTPRNIVITSGRPSANLLILQVGRILTTDRRFGSNRRIEVVTTAFNLVPQLIIGTSRIATLLRRLAIFYQRYLPLKLVAPPFEILPLEKCLRWHKSRDHDPGTVWLRSVLKSAMAESGIPKRDKSTSRMPAGQASLGAKHRVPTSRRH
jgi:hypothetical protein